MGLYQPDIMVTLYVCIPIPDIMGVYLPDIMVTLYGCIPTRYNGHSLCVYTYIRCNGHLLWVYTNQIYRSLIIGIPDIMVTLYVCIPIPDITVNYYVCILIPDIMVTYYVCIPTVDCKENFPPTSRMVREEPPSRRGTRTFFEKDEVLYRSFKKVLHEHPSRTFFRNILQEDHL